MHLLVHPRGTRQGVIGSVDGIAAEDLQLQRSDVLDMGLPRFRHLIERTLLRRTKKGLIHGQPIIQDLPQKVLCPVIQSQMEVHEEQFYSQLAMYCHDKFLELKAHYFRNRHLIQVPRARTRRARAFYPERFFPIRVVLSGWPTGRVGGGDQTCH